MRKLVREKKIGVNQVCKLFKISKKTYYQCKDPEKRFLKKYADLKGSVVKVIRKNPSYGIRRIKSALKKDYGIVIGRDTLGRLLKEWGLELKRNVKRIKKSFIQKILIKLAGRANILIRTTVTAPLQGITSDITMIRCAAGKAYLCVHNDVFGQLVYGWELAQNMELGLVMSSFTKALRKLCRIKVPKSAMKNIIWHQDQGSQYTSYDYVQAVLNAGIISFSKKGTPTENPGQESFIGRLKEECEHEFLECQTFEELKALVKLKINYYNERRLHTSIDYQTPKEFTESFLKFS